MNANQMVIGERYARALFEVAQKQDVSDQVYDELQALAQVYQSIPELGRIFADSYLDYEQESVLFKQLCQSFSPLVQNLLKVARKYHRVDTIPAIIKAYNHLYDEYHGVIRGSVTSVIPLTEAQLAQLEKEVAHILGYQKAKLANHLDDAIIGGVLIEANGRIIDRTLRHRLQQMQRAMLSV